MDTIPAVAPIDTNEITSPAEEEPTPTELEELERTTTEYLTPTTTNEVAPATTEELVPEIEEEVTPVTTESLSPETVRKVVPTTTEATTSSAIRELDPESVDETVLITTEETMPAASEAVIPENVTPGTADTIVARVFGAPVVASSEDVQMPPIASEEPSSVIQAEKVEQASPAKAADCSTPVTPKQPVAARNVPLTTATATGPKSSTTTSKPDQGPKLTSWLKNKFYRSKSAKPSVESSEPMTKSSTLTKAAPKTEPATAKTLSPQAPALLGTSAGGAATTDKHDPAPLAAHPTRSRSTSISSLSSDVPTATHAHAAESKDEHESEPMRGRTRGHEVRQESTAADPHDASTPEESEEARDHFDAEKLPLPTFAAGQKPAESPVRDSRFVEDL